MSDPQREARLRNGLAVTCNARFIVQIPRDHPVIFGECMNRTKHPSGRCFRHR